MLKNTRRLVAVAAGAVLVTAGCGAPGDGDDAARAEPTAATGQADPQTDPAQDGAGPNTDDIPDPVAEVNGTEITKDEFVTVFEGQYQQMAMRAQMTGQPVDEDQLRAQTLEGLVGSELLRQEALERGLEVSDAEIDTALAGFAESNQASEDEFFAAMGEQGLDRDDVMDQIEKQLLVEKLIVDEYGEFSATDEEIEAAYQQLAQQQAMSGGQAGGGLPPLEQVRDEVEEQLVAEQQAQAMQMLSEELREGADVTEHL
ncbi:MULTISPECIES: SurA N-terminal domain-containing protein [unclassified Dietzia]|uniref:SurA N-terminal domain-containing protein n=1 Tax=unclassified Dietzia TaxID=2617939 RepID=UPI000D20DEAC|nr:MULTISPECIES: SurA N-terminal domain-containing protein [unclassified Dietzia]AVZ38490.1 peptidylprolyl isomerase [Dietzia sp. JS16-p6b]QGW23536.1 SurA domain-containing protein [Dietzia sp. DQ12-45-1b]